MSFDYWIYNDWKGWEGVGDTTPQKMIHEIRQVFPKEGTPPPGLPPELALAFYYYVRLTVAVPIEILDSDSSWVNYHINIV